MGCKQVNSQNKRNNNQNDNTVNVSNRSIADAENHVAEPPESHVEHINNISVNVEEAANEELTSSHPTQPMLKLTQLSNELIQIEFTSPTSTASSNWTHTFPNNALLSDIVAHFTKTTSTPLSNPIKLNDTQLLPLSTPILELFPPNTHQLTLTFSYLPDLSDSYHLSITNNLQHLSQLLTYNNSLLLLTFHRKTRTFTSKYYTPPFTTAQTQIHLYSPSSSATCNAPNILYISGGDSALTHFWKIDLLSTNITSHRVGLPYGKASHSMIYIPHNYVFIVGGNDNNVCYYVEDADTFEQWAALESAHAEPACAFVNDALLFVFSAHEREFKCEKTNLRAQPCWEKVAPRFESDTLRMQQRLFGCCWDAKDEKVVLFGGSAEEERKGETGLIAYDWKADVFVETKIKFMQCELAERTFLPFNNKYSYVIPKITAKDVKLVCYNNETKAFKEIAFVEDEAEALKNKTKLAVTISNFASYNKSSISNTKYCFNMPTLHNTHSQFNMFQKAPKVNKTYKNTPFGNSITNDTNNDNNNGNNVFDQLNA